mgnify:CR=1 FL=1
MRISAVIKKIKSLCKIKGEDFVHEDHGVIKVYNFRQINRMLYPYTGDITISRFEAIAFPYCIEFIYGGQPIKAFLDRAELEIIVGVTNGAFIKRKLYGIESTPTNKLTIKLNRLEKTYYEKPERTKWNRDFA